MEREEEREWGEWEGVGRRGGNGNFYKLINFYKLNKKKKQAALSSQLYGLYFSVISVLFLKTSVPFPSFLFFLVY